MTRLSPRGVSAPVLLLAGLQLAAASADAQTVRVAGPSASALTPSGATTGAELWREYTRSPNHHPLIPNNSYAGYRYSEVPVPVHRPTPENIARAINVRSLGARGDGQTDDTRAFRNAIERAGRPGLVFVPAGTYRITDVIRVTRSDLVIFGEGSGRSTLYFDTPLEKALGSWGRGEQTRWSSYGGLLWVGTRDSWAADGRLADDFDQGWKNPYLLGRVVGTPKRGDTRLELSTRWGQALPKGLILLTWQSTGEHSLEHAMGGHERMAEYDYADAFKLHRSWQWPVEIARVVERSAVGRARERLVVELKQPLRMDIRSEWRVAVEYPRSTDGEPAPGEPTGYVQEVGIEGLSLRMASHRPFQHLRDPGFNGPFFDRAFNCWVRDVVIDNADLSLGIAASKNITVQDVVLTGGQHHHGLYVRNGAHDILFERFHIRSRPHHGISISGRSTGVVWRHGVMEAGTFDSHRALPFDVVRTNITVRNTGDATGDAESGPRNGARVVHWNVRITNGQARHIYQPDEFTMSALVGVQGAELSAEPGKSMPPGEKGTIVLDHGRTPYPADLFEAQLRLRLGSGRPSVPVAR